MIKITVEGPRREVYLMCLDILDTRDSEGGTLFGEPDERNFSEEDIGVIVFHADRYERTWTCGKDHEHKHGRAHPPGIAEQSDRGCGSGEKQPVLPGTDERIRRRIRRVKGRKGRGEEMIYQTQQHSITENVRGQQSWTRCCLRSRRKL